MADATDIAITYLRAAFGPNSAIRDRFAELFAAKCENYYSLRAAGRPNYIKVTLPIILRALLASTVFPDDFKPDDLSFSGASLAPPHAEPDESDTVKFLLGVVNSWTDSLDSARIYAAVGAEFQSLVDPLEANYKYGFFMDTPTLEHADYLAGHPEAVTYIRTTAASRYYANVAWDTYIDRFPKNAKRPQREPDSSLILSKLDQIVGTPEVTL
jgi:hypothetical protein